MKQLEYKNSYVLAPYLFQSCIAAGSTFTIIGRPNNYGNKQYLVVYPVEKRVVITNVPMGNYQHVVYNVTNSELKFWEDYIIRNYQFTKA